MLRTAMKPKWLALLALVIAVTVGFFWLGRWQLDVAQEKGLAEATREAAARPAAPLTEVLQPDGKFPTGALDRTVTVAGEYVAAHQVLITGRQLDGRNGYWVVTPLLVEGSRGHTQNGPAAIPVLRGFVADAAAAPPPPTGRVAITGTLGQSEPSPDQFRQLPEGQVQTLNVPALLNRWGGDLYNGFVFLATQDPPGTATLSPVAPPAAGVGQLNWRNLGYAIQWFFFAAFALYMWWRMVREDARVDAPVASGGDDAVGASGGADGPAAPDVPDDSGSRDQPQVPRAPDVPTKEGEPSR